MAPRRNRVPHLNSSTTARPIDRFQPSDEDWKRIEDVYTMPLDEELRDGVTKIVDSYLYWAPFETEAVTVKDVQREIKRVMKAAEALSYVLGNLHQKGEVGVETRLLIERNLPSKVRRRIADDLLGDRWSKEKFDRLRQEAASGMENVVLARMLELHQIRQRLSSDIADAPYDPKDLITACQAATEELTTQVNEKAGFDIGDAWAEMIRKLMDWAKRAGRDHSISTNRERSPSKLVEFVWAIQELLPENYRRHMQSKESLADAIYKASHVRH